MINKRNFGNALVMIALDEIEQQSMQTDLVTIPLSVLTNSMNTAGKAVLHGIFFNTDQVKLKPESTPALKTIKSYLGKL